MASSLRGQQPTAPFTIPPSLIREPLYAPQCPPPAAALFDAALVLQNEGKFAFAINTMMQAQQAWEQCLLEEHYPDIEDKVAHSILLRLRQNEQREIEAAEAERALREAEEAEEERRRQAAAASSKNGDNGNHNGNDDDDDDALDKDEEELLRQMAALNSESDAAAEERMANERAKRREEHRLSKQQQQQQIKRQSVIDAELERHKKAVEERERMEKERKEREEREALDPNAAFLQQQHAKMQSVLEEAARRKAEEEEAARVAFNAERERKRQEKIQALHQVYQLLPLEGKIFIQLRLCSIYESAGDDEKALATALYALKFVQTLSSHNDHTFTATVYACLGNIYSHLAQFDYAADYLFKALEIREFNLGEGHIDTATIMHNIGCVLHNLEKPNDALVCYYKALDVFQKVLPSSHPRIDLCQANIRKSKEMKFNNLIVPPVPVMRQPVRK